MAQAGLGRHFPAPPQDAGPAQAGLGGAPMPRAHAPAPEPEMPSLTMSDRLGLIQEMGRRGMSPVEINAELARFGTSTEGAEPVDDGYERPSLMEQAGYGLREHVGRGSLEGLGHIGEQIGMEGAGDAAMAAANRLFGDEHPEEDRFQRAAEEASFGRSVAEGMAQSAPTLASTVAGGVAGAKTGAAIGSVAGPGGATAGGLVGGLVGGAASMYPMMVADSAKTAEMHGGSMDDPETATEVMATAGVRAGIEGLVAGKLGSLLSEPAKQALTQTMRSSISRAPRAAAGYGTAEGLANVTSQIVDMAVFDPELREKLDEGDVQALAPMVADKYGSDAARDFLIGFGLGGGAGAGGASINQRKANAERQREVETLKDAAEGGGLDLATLEAAARDPEQVGIISEGAPMMEAARKQVSHAQQVLEAARAQGDEAAIAEAEARMEQANEMADQAFDAVVPRLGGQTSSEIRARETAEVDAASQELISEDVATPEYVAQTDGKTLKAQRQRLADARDEVAEARAEVEAGDALTPDARSAAEQRLRKAEEDLNRTRDGLAIATGRSTESDIQARNQARERDSAREQAVGRIYERRFTQPINEGRVDDVEADARGVIERAKKSPDKNLKREITRMERRLERAESVAEMEKIETQIAEKRARVGVEAPAVEAARRALRDVEAMRAQRADPEAAETSPAPDTPAPETGRAPEQATPEPATGEGLSPPAATEAPAVDAAQVARSRTTEEPSAEPESEAPAAPRQRSRSEQDADANAALEPLRQAPPVDGPDGMEAMMRRAQKRREVRNTAVESLSADDSTITLTPGEGATSGAIVSPRMDGEDGWRISRFDNRGFSGDSAFATKREAIDAAIEAGNTRADSGAIRRAMASGEWTSGETPAEAMSRTPAEPQQPRAKKPRAAQRRRRPLSYDGDSAQQRASAEQVAGQQDAQREAQGQRSPVTATPRRGRDQDGAYTDVEMSTGRTIRMRRLTGPEGGGLSGWHADDSSQVHAAPAGPGSGWLGDTQAGAIQRLTEMEQSRQAETPAPAEPTPAPAEPEPAPVEPQQTEMDLAPAEPAPEPSGMDATRQRADARREREQRQRDQEKRSGSRAYRDHVDDLGDVTTPANADEFVQSMGGVDGTEFYVAYNPDTGEVVGAGTIGEAERVSMSVAADRAMADPSGNLHVTHNHPNQSPLSSTDLAQIITQPGLQQVRATTRNGHSTARKGPAVKNADPETARDTARALRDARRASLDAVQAKPGLLGKPNAFVASQRGFVRGVADAGLIEYTDTFPALEGADLTRIEEAAYDAARKSLRDSPVQRLRDDGAADPAARDRGDARPGALRPERPGAAARDRDGGGVLGDDRGRFPGESTGEPAVRQRAGRSGDHARDAGTERAPLRGETVAGVEPVRAFEFPDGRTVYEVADPAAFTAAAEASIPTVGPLGAQVGTDPGTRQFLFDDGNSGFALDGDNIISVFSSNASPSGVITRTMDVAIAQGGRRLDGFDTFLPRAYAKQGFRAVARLPFNRDFAPDGWDYDFFQRQFATSDPDVVFMVYDPQNATDWRDAADTDNVISDYGDGETAQRAALADRAPDALAEDVFGGELPALKTRGLPAGRQNRYVDDSANLPDSMTPDQAIARVLEKGADGNEHQVSVLDSGTVVGAGTHQLPNAVGLSDAGLELRRQPGPSWQMIHNHPRETVPSAADVVLAHGSMSPMTVTAVTPSGSVHSVRVRPSVRDGVSTGGFSGAVTDAGRAAFETMPGTMDTTTRSGVSQLANLRAMSDLGIIDYETSGESFNLTDEQQGYFDDARTAAHKTLRQRIGDRNADGAGTSPQNAARLAGSQAVRPDGRTAQADDQRAAERLETEIGLASEKFDSTFLPAARKKIDAPPWLDVQTAHGRAVQDMADAAKNPRDTLPRVWKWFENNFINQLSGLRDLELNIKGKLGQGMDSAFKAAEIALNDSGRNETLMHYGGGDIDVHGAFRPAEGTIGLRPMLSKLENAGYSDKGQAAVDWMEYMVARRASDLKKRGIKTPLTDADIQRGLDKKNAVFDEVAADWKRFNDANVDMLVKTGRVSKALGAKLKEDAAYVPLYRSDETVEGTNDMFDNTELAKRVSRGPTGRGGILARDPGIKRIKGGDRLKINNVIENMIRNSQAMVAASMRNQAANKSFDLLEHAGYARVEPARMQSQQTGEWVARKMPDHAVRMWRDGEESYLVPETAEAVPVLIGLAGLQPQQLNGIHRQMANIASFFRQGITLSPAFIIRNTWRDMVSTGVLTSGRNLRLDNNLVTGVVASLKRSASRRAFTAQSGMGDFRFGGRDIGLGRNDYMIELGVLPKTAGYQLRRVIGAGEMLGTASELSNRIALMDQLVSEGVRHDEAAYQALTITNYSRKGSNAVLRSMLPLIPFLNARIQGLARIGEDVTARRGKDRQQAIMRLALNGTVLATASTLLWGWNNRDEEHRERYLAEPLHRRLNYNIVYGENTKILIPKAFEVGTIFGTVPEIMMEAMAGNTEEIGPAAVMTLTNTFGFNPMPAAVLPAFEVAADYNFFTGQAIEGGRLSGLLARDRINPQTSATAVALGRAGLSDHAGLSPVVLDHLLYGYGGVYYSTLAAMTDMVAGEMGLVPREPEGKFGSVPFASQGLQQALGGMVRDVDADVANKYMGDFYEHRNAISQIYRSSREAALSGDVEYAREIMARAPATPEAYRFVNSAGSRMSQVNSEIRRIRMDRQLSAAEKRKKLQPLVKTRNDLSMKVMQHIRRMEDAQGTSFRRAS